MSNTDVGTTAADNGLVLWPVKSLVPKFSRDPLHALRETLEYATSPKDFLLERLGQSVFEKRSELLSLFTDQVDRDSYGTGAHKQHFEQHIAKFLGKQHGLFFITGVQAQLTAIKIHCDVAGNDKVAWHFRSHLEIAEQRGYAEVFNLKRTFVGSSQLALPTVGDVQSITSLPADERPAVILLELPNRELGCKTYSWDDLLQISQLCKAANVKLHMDGARLWEVEPFYRYHNRKSFTDLAALFDSVYISFYKGLGGVCGSMLTSNDEMFINVAKTWQRRMGGNMVTSYQEIIDCERGFNTNIGTFLDKYRKMVSLAAAITAATAAYRTKDDQPIVSFNPSIPTCSQVHTHIQGATKKQIETARDTVEKELGIRVLNNFQPWKSPEELAKLVEQDSYGPHESHVLQETPEEESEPQHHFMEWSIRDENFGIADDVFVRGWSAFCQLLAVR